MAVTALRDASQRLAPLLAVTFLVLLSGCGAAPPPAGGPVVLVVVDTLRPDHLGLYGHSRDTSPELDAWAQAGRVYERAWSTSSWTLPSVASLFTGRLPSAHGAVAVLPLPRENPLFGRLPDAIPTLAERFSRAGYATAAFVTNPYLKPLLGLDRGFDVYDYAAASQSPGRRADSMVERALSWIDTSSQRPFFLLLHLIDPHMDYAAPPPQRGRFTQGETSRLELPVGSASSLREGRFPKPAGGAELGPEDWSFVSAAYDEEIAFVDAQLGRLRRGLEKRGILERGIVAFTADHGEEFFEHGGFEHGHSLHEEVVRVPLVFWGAGVRAGRERAPVSLADVADTLLEGAGLSAPEGSQGVSLWPNLSRGEPIAERTLHFQDVLYGEDRRGAVRWPWKAVVSDATGSEYWNLEEDPGEQVLPTGKIPPAVARLLVEIQAQGHTGNAEATALDHETRQELEALGYLE